MEVLAASEARSQSQKEMRWSLFRCAAKKGEELVFIRGLYDVVPNVEMCELEKEMDKDESVVFRVGWTTR